MELVCGCRVGCNRSKALLLGLLALSSDLQHRLLYTQVSDGEA